MGPPYCTFFFLKCILGNIIRPISRRILSRDRGAVGTTPAHQPLRGEELSRTLAGEGPLTMLLYTFRASRDPKHSKLHSFNCLAGCFNGGVVRIISDIRLKHGPNAVNLDNCGKFVLADDLSGLADISHIDLSNIGSLEGTCRASLLG